jgi:hypothetical protein
MVEKAMEDDIVLSKLILSLRGFLLKQFQANDSSDVKAIASYLLEKGNIEHSVPVAVLDYLKKNLAIRNSSSLSEQK